MATDGNDDFGAQLAALLATEFMRDVQKVVKSETIKRTLFVLTDPLTTTSAVIAAPYWARYYHDGRGVVTAKSASVLVWFKNPDDDPRIPGDGAIRATDVRRLTKSEFKAAEEAGLLVITQRAGPSKPNPFFLHAEPLFASRVDGLAAGLLTDWMRDHIPGGAGVQESTATLRIKF